MPVDKKRKEMGCPVEATLAVICGRWKVLAIYHLLQGEKRFGELTRSLDGVAPRTLSKQLRELEADGILSRKDFGETPPKVEYSLTKLGKSLEPVLLSMESWGLEQEKRHNP